MILISQHSRLLDFQFPPGAVFRVNAAWIKTKAELFELLEQIKGKVFLDYPNNRTKPPKPSLFLEDMFEAMERFTNIEFFAVSNVVNGYSVEGIRRTLPERIILVPKIESKEGIDNLEIIMDSLNKDDRYLMLDKEDLYIDLNKNDSLFEEYIDIIRDKCKKHDYQLLELMGVIFSNEFAEQDSITEEIKKKTTIESVLFNRPTIIPEKKDYDKAKAMLYES